MGNYILYGAGLRIKDYISFIKMMGDNISCILDSSKEKTGDDICGIRICSPYSFDDNGEKIIITCMAFDEVRRVLKQLGLTERELGFDGYLDQKKAEYAVNGVSEEGALADPVRNVCFDLFSPADWGGAERWNLTCANYLADHDGSGDVTLIKRADIALNGCSERLNIMNVDEGSGLFGLVDCCEDGCFFNSFFSTPFFAMLYLKITRKRKIRISTVVHNDFVDLYELCSIFDRFTDRYYCVSSKIAGTLTGSYGISDKKTAVVCQPVIGNDPGPYDKGKGDMIRIGIASRITKPQKRCDRIPLIIETLESSNVRYELRIAGDGDYLNELKEFVQRRGVENKVSFLGRLSEKEMDGFWSKTDVYLNFSDFEGTSLAMLEAMSHMCVPVVMNVSGVEDYIVDGVNGMIHDPGDIKGICSSVAYLWDNKFEMEKMGLEAGRSVREKCDIKKLTDELLLNMGETE